MVKYTCRGTRQQNDGLTKSETNLPKFEGFLPLFSHRNGTISPIASPLSLSNNDMLMLVEKCLSLSCKLLSVIMTVTE